MQLCERVSRSRGKVLKEGVEENDAALVSCRAFQVSSHLNIQIKSQARRAKIIGQFLAMLKIKQNCIVSICLKYYTTDLALY